MAEILLLNTVWDTKMKYLCISFVCKKKAIWLNYTSHELKKIDQILDKARSYQWNPKYYFCASNTSPVSVVCVCSLSKAACTQHYCWRAVRFYAVVPCERAKIRTFHSCSSFMCVAKVRALDPRREALGVVLYECPFAILNIDSQLVREQSFQTVN